MKAQIRGYGPVSLGAFALGGTLVLPGAHLPPGVGAELVRAARSTTVAPSELPWLDALSQKPALTILRRSA